MVNRIFSRLFRTRRGTGVTPVDNPLYLQECGGCHFPYQPGLLPARSWNKLMGGLEPLRRKCGTSGRRHQALTDYLVRNAADHANFKRSRKIMNALPPGETPLRVSETPYFIDKHGQLSRAMVQDNPGVVSISRCRGLSYQCGQGFFQRIGSPYSRVRPLGRQGLTTGGRVKTGRPVVVSTTGGSVSSNKHMGTHHEHNAMYPVPGLGPAGPAVPLDQLPSIFSLIAVALIMMYKQELGITGTDAKIGLKGPACHNRLRLRRQPDHPPGMGFFASRYGRWAGPCRGRASCDRCAAT